MDTHSTFLVHHMNLLTSNQRERYQILAAQITAVHLHTCDLVVFISGVVIDTLRGITAAGVNGLFIKMANFYTALLLRNRSENMKYLA